MSQFLPQSSGQSLSQPSRLSSWLGNQSFSAQRSNLQRPNLQRPDSQPADLSGAKPAHSPGTLYGVGVGPGDPELITLKALKYLQSVPVVAFPAGIQGRPGVAETIVEPWLQPRQHRLPLVFPYVQAADQLQAAWDKAAGEVWPYLQAGDVVFACEGDVSFYGTFTYLAQSLQAQYPELRVQTIAGISSPMAAAAVLGIPLACQSERVAILPALYTVGELEDALAWAEVIVLMKVASVYAQVWQILARYRLLDCSYVVENATRPDQKIYAGLKAHADLELPYFSLLIVQPGKAGVKNRTKTGISP